MEIGSPCWTIFATGLSKAVSRSRSLFTAIDQRETTTIPVPDTTRRYRVISRQSLDAAEVAAREGTNFKGALKITKPEEFWAPSRFLILLKQ